MTTAIEGICRAMTTAVIPRLSKNYRVAEMSYEASPLPDVEPRVGLPGPKIAEARVREKLRAGIPVEDACLVSPHVGTKLRLGDGGHLLEPAYAWRGDSTPLFVGTDLYNYGGFPVKASIEAYRCQPDPTAGNWAGAFAVVVTEGRITSLTIPNWLGPVAPSLRVRYGIPVNVNSTGTPDREPSECEPLVIRQVITADEAVELRKHHERTQVNFDKRDGKETSRSPALRQGLIDGLMQKGRDHFRIGVNQAANELEGYRDGAGHDWRADRGAPGSLEYAWNVIYHVLLSEPGADHTGGAFETRYGPVEASVGDCIAFTAATEYRIMPVKSGRRSVLAVYGSWDGWD